MAKKARAKQALSAEEAARNRAAMVALAAERIESGKGLPAWLDTMEVVGALMARGFTVGRLHRAGVGAIPRHLRAAYLAGEESLA